MIKFNRKPTHVDKSTKIPIFDFQAKAINEFSVENSAKIHDNALKWLFDSHYLTENEFREKLISKLNLKTGDKVLITAAGSANDVKYIAKRVGIKGEIFIQDYAQEMLIAGYYRCKKDKDLKNYNLNFFVNDALNLPFNDCLFDVTFHFGGLNLYADRKRGIEEMHRVTKKGGKVLFGDEGLACWLKKYEKGKAQITNNPLYRFDPPLECLPIDVENVNLSWLISNCYYVIEYIKSKKPWHYDENLRHKGIRGGSVKTRNFGQLEGIDPDLKNKFYKKILKSNKSRVDVLESIILNYLKND